MTWRKFVGSRITLYRSEYVQGLSFHEGCWVPEYTLGHLKARIGWIRVPVLWACDQLIIVGRMRGHQ